MQRSNQSTEDYLETILVLQQKQGEVRAIDIVNETGYTKPSISIAMKKLLENRLIERDGKGRISLTQAGAAIAHEVYHKHCMLLDFFAALGVSPETAAADACKIEHLISDETFAAMERHWRQKGNK